MINEIPEGRRSSLVSALANGSPAVALDATPRGAALGGEKMTAKW